jgi:hypothetical protein
LVMVGSRAGGGGAIFDLLPSCMCMHGYEAGMGARYMSTTVSWIICLGLKRDEDICWMPGLQAQE